MTAPILILVLLVVVVLGSLAMLTRRVPSGYVGVQQRLGRFHRVLEPGLHLVVPGDKIERVSLAERTAALVAQPVLTQDDQTLEVSARTTYRLVDARAATYEIADPRTAIEQLSLTVLRSWAVGLDATSALGSVGAATEAVQQALAEALPRWGIEPGRTEVRLERGGWE